MAIINAQLTDTQLDLIQVPAGKRYAITNILVCNNNLAGAEANFDMHLIPSGDSLDNSVTCVIRELLLPIGETFTFDSEKVVLEEGDKLAFVAGPGDGNGDTNLSATVSYLEV